MHQRQFPAERLVVARQFRCLLFQRLEFGTHRFVVGAKLRKRVAQAEIVTVFLLQGLQRGANGLNQVAEGILDVVERGDPTVGVDQQVTQSLVALAKAGAEIRKCPLVVLCGAVRAPLIGGWGHRERRGCNALTPEKIGDRTHGMPHS